MISKKLNFILIYFILQIITLTVSISQEMFQDIKNPEYYVDEICSFNQNSSIIIKNNTNTEIKCICRDGYVSSIEPETFNNQKIQCDYKQKRRIIVLFFSIFMLFGFEYLYLEKTLLFVIILFFYIIAIIGNCYIIIIDSESKDDARDTRKKTRFTIKAFTLLIFVWWIFNNIYIVTGFIDDTNYIKTFDDLSKFFSL